MGRLRTLILVIAFFFLVTQREVYAENLQSLIDQTPDGGTIILEDKLYSEPISIDRPIRVIGQPNSGFQICSDTPAISISGEGVTIENVKIMRCLGESGSTAMFISGKNHHVTNMEIEAENVGILLEGVENSTFENIKLTGEGKRNGIEIWNSYYNIFQQNEIKNVTDGFYLESSPFNIFRQNYVEGSRYGLHIMYSDEVTVKENTFMDNVTGAMIMETENTVVENNLLGGNKKNVNAQGLLLYDVYHSTIKGNQIEDNRVGMFIENSEENAIVENRVYANFIGAQLNRAKNNTISHNSFILNINTIQGINSENNEIMNNFWEDASVLDTDGDGKSNLKYSADPFFLQLTEEADEYQLFFHHPGMVVLQKLLKSPEHLLLTDEKPLMEEVFVPNNNHHSNSGFIWFLSMT
ncbi:right-handed parallel beta-helix repeat-containing protein [Fervidibacillus halotolerans]|uniref:Right-handed parallel beta-helix repeat-containing protein n=1 Tax=Fervidibacillus halotolerans TaxID=2980027 RepID=A0A9E8M038_9BACI|nr:NosD domain-containing protein [Fervidibacillus halotolerans]WAA12988.1 right-handed parallel beta-helix repeat-containing protein [Fervidibacillus halotolerans]